jgi:hypothetical protein
MHYSNAPDVAERIALKLALLRKWLAEGLPKGAYLPKSLATAREWDDPEISAFKVGSKRDWNSINSPHRTSVLAIGSALKALRKVAASQNRPAKKTTKERLEDLKLRVEVAELAREEVSGQWQATSQKLQRSLLELKVSTARIEHLEEKIRSADETIARLKREFYKVHQR